MSKISITATTEMTDCIKQLAKERGVTADEAADVLLRAGWSRLVATSKWYEKKKDSKAKKARKTKSEAKARKPKSNKPKKARKADEPVAQASEPVTQANEVAEAAE